MATHSSIWIHRRKVLQSEGSIVLASRKGPGLGEVAESLSGSKLPGPEGGPEGFTKISSYSNNGYILHLLSTHHRFL